MKKVLIAVVVFMVMATSSIMYAADLCGIVADKDGKPVVTKVMLKDTTIEPVTTDKNGSYAFKDIKPGSYHVVVGEKDEWKIFVGPGETRRDFRLK